MKQETIYLREYERYANRIVAELPDFKHRSRGVNYLLASVAIPHLKASCRKQVGLILFLCFCISAALATTISGRVVGVMDGDTIEILSNRQTYRLRLDGIDCPEKSQAFGNAAKQVCSNLCFGKTAKAVYTDKDRYGRYLAKVILPGGAELNATLLKNGYAWHYKQYSKDAYYAALELAARKAKAGLWADKNPIPPWQYRRGVSVQQSGTQTTGVFTASQNSKIFHKPACELAKKIKPANRIWFSSRSDATKRGYKACKRCKP